MLLIATYQDNNLINVWIVSIKMTKLRPLLEYVGHTTTHKCMICSFIVAYPFGEQNKPGPEVIKLFSCSTQLSMNFQLLITTKVSSSLSYVVFIMLINVKMPKIVAILTFMSM